MKEPRARWVWQKKILAGGIWPATSNELLVSTSVRHPYYLQYSRKQAVTFLFSWKVDCLQRALLQDLSLSTSALPGGSNLWFLWLEVKSLKSGLLACSRLWTYASLTS